MTTQQSQFPPQSLAWHFEAPEGFRGEFGWLCGYSADPDFMDDAVERFTRWTKHQRAYAGQIALAMMLDPGNRQITPTDVPGVVHLPAKSGRKPFRLLHAKVAVLGYRHESDADRWIVRLIVATGNWTDATLEQSLDLVWSIEINSEQITSGEQEVRQTCADIQAAWRFLRWLREHFDTRLTDYVPPEREETPSFVAQRHLVEWLDRIGEKAGSMKPRFVDNRKHSLLAQLPSLIDQDSGTRRRNYLAMGSGFFESASAGHEGIPTILNVIAGNLHESGLLTAEPEVDVFVNPAGCQAVAGAANAIQQAGWSIRAAGKPDYFGNTQRSLHAKFIFSASYRSNSETCNNPWLYLGSGNLTGPGFGNPMSTNGGNLEAGVVFVLEPLCWDASKNIPPEAWVCNRLPIQWENAIEEPAKLAVGSDMPERAGEYFASPIACLAWENHNGGGWLRPLGDMSDGEFELLDLSGNACVLDDTQGFYWPSKRPRQVTVRWQEHGQNQQADVPVIDEFGRVAATTLPALDIQAAWWQLAEFPSPTEDAPPESDGSEDADDAASGDGALGTKVQGPYPIRQLMELIENIADKQTHLEQTDWPAWCIRLEQSLAQAADAEVLEHIRHMGLNPLSPLWHPPFRPDFALNASTPEGRRYEDVVGRVERIWQVSDLKRIGEDV